MAICGFVTGTIFEKPELHNLKIILEQDKIEHPMPTDKVEEIRCNLFGKQEEKKRED